MTESQKLLSEMLRNTKELADRLVVAETALANAQDELIKALKRGNAAERLALANHDEAEALRLQLERARWDIESRDEDIRELRWSLQRADSRIDQLENDSYYRSR